MNSKPNKEKLTVGENGWISYVDSVLNGQGTTMAGTNLLTLLDDITTLLDDIATMSKVATKTAGVLGDDLALNAQQVTGVTADRELPVVWAVAKGSFINKAILVPAALLISVWLPWLITPLLMIGGLFLCFEGAEKIIEKLFGHDSHEGEQLVEQQDLQEYEKQKVKGAIRTDFILSAEIIVITLGTVAGATLVNQALVLSVIAIIMTIGVYGLVAGIVKLDDAGLYLLQKAQQSGGKFKELVGKFLLAAAPKLMRFLAFAGTVAMFLVGGGILVHGIPLHHAQQGSTEFVTGLLGKTGELVSPVIFDGLLGVVAGVVIVIFVSLFKKISK